LESRQRRRPHAHLGEDGRSRIVRSELADLPLLREHPQRIADLDSEGAVEVGAPRPPLQPVPERHGREELLGERRAEIGNEVARIHLAYVAIRS
jgi:hypothetical protein